MRRQETPDAKITYPAGQIFKPKFSPEGISVYEGSVEITAALPKGRLASAAHAALRIEVQACTEPNLPSPFDSHVIRKSLMTYVGGSDWFSSCTIFPM